MELINRFEKPARLAPDQQREARESFERIAERGNLQEYSNGQSKGYFISNVGKHDAVVIPDYEYGILHVDIDTGIVVTEDNAVKLWAYASFCGFKYKFCALSTAPSGQSASSFAWDVGDPIHLVSQIPVGLWSQSAVVESPLCMAFEIREGFIEIASGKSGVAAVIAGDDDDPFNMVDALSRMRGSL